MDNGTVFKTKNKGSAWNLSQKSVYDMQWKYGLASYKGSHGVEYNLEEAYRWINKAVNQLCASSASPKRGLSLILLWQILL